MVEINSNYDTIVVGSGASGAALALEQAKKGKKVLVLEQGKIHPNLGNLGYAFEYYDLSPQKALPQTKEGVIYQRSIMSGGSTVVSCGNGTHCLEPELAKLGLDISQEAIEVEKELKINLTPEDFLTDGSRAIRSAAEQLGYKFTSMPKMMDFTKCKKCGQCSFGCASQAKWTSHNQILAAQQAGAEIRYNSTVTKILHENGSVQGLLMKENGNEVKLVGKNIVLSAGGLGTPVILQNSGISAGQKLFMDMYINVWAKTNGLNHSKEPQMSLVCTDFHKSDGFIMSPMYVSDSSVRNMMAGAAARPLNAKNTIGLMCKINDDMDGTVDQNGTISKKITPNDQKKLDKAFQVAKDILIKAGGDPNLIIKTQVQGAHPGGTAAIGDVVNNQLQTKINGLYVCDASVLPESPGFPPIITLVALGKKLGRQL